MRSAVFAVSLAAVLALAISSCGAHDMATHQAQGHDSHADGGGHDHADSASTGGGLTNVQAGFRLSDLAAPTAAGESGELSFRIVAPTGQPQLDFQVEQERRMHVYVVRADLGDFYHVHPEMDATGRWKVPLTLVRPGPYHVVTEFVAASANNETHHLVLGEDINVAGAYQAEPLKPPSREASADDYTVTVNGEIVAGGSSMLTLRITRKADSTIADLQPYLGSYAHLTAFHEGDLEAVHLHPEQSANPDLAGGRELTVHAELPAAGKYRMFIQFQVDGRVHTAPITIDAR